MTGYKDIFKEIELADKPWADRLLAFSDYRATEYNFSVLYIWKDVYKTKIARYKEFLLIRSGSNNSLEGYTYLFPAGRGDVKEALAFMMDDAKQNNVPFRMASVLEEQKNIMEELFPNRFSYTPVRNSFDYIYAAKDLIALKGKKYQSKRNFVSRFKANNNWQYEEITLQNISECAQMNEQWCKLYGCTQDFSLSQEACSVRKAISDFEALALKGGLLRVNGNVVAFSLGEKMNSDTFLVHIEKAFANVQGAYPAISQMFLSHQTLQEPAPGEELDNRHIGFVYVNREDDAGDMGLRNAKLQYHPVFMIEKYIVAELEN